MLTYFSTLRFVARNTPFLAPHKSVSEDVYYTESVKEGRKIHIKDDIEDIISDLRTEKSTTGNVSPNYVLAKASEAGINLDELHDMVPKAGKVKFGDFPEKLQDVILEICNEEKIDFHKEFAMQKLFGFSVESSDIMTDLPAR